MDCLLKLGFSYTLKNIVQKIVDDKSCYSVLVGTDEWRLATHLDSQIQKRVMCERQCLGCLEFVRVASMFTRLTTDIVTANDEHKPLVECICKMFEIDTGVDPVVLALELISAPSYLKSKIHRDLVSDYDKYESAINGAFYSLALDHYMHEQAKCSDTVMSYGDLESKQVVSYFPFEKQVAQKIFYLDQNIISKCSNDSSLRKQVIDFRNKTGCEFVYSPYVIEDGIKMSSIRLSEYFDVVSEITNNSMLANIEGQISLVKEDIGVTSQRVLLWRGATKAAEDQKIYKMHYNHWGYSHYSRQSRISKRVNKDINAFLESLRPHLEEDEHDLDFDDFESEYSICRRLYAATIGKSFSLNDLVNGSIPFESEQECVGHIEDLCEFLDLINYQTESLSEPEKIKSSLQDVEHLKHAWKADYFVTEDNRLRARGEFIYSVLRIKTKFLDAAGFKGQIIAEFKTNA
ncbi:hypothetical protein [Pseudomonas sp. 8 R 14]|uniref:hypothetical protein n=1 Tax=Pseudomonas sp. 8 R 14 TaxID=1844092 RepID=UPI0008129A17|nr:hypothetical protein [Pseudomonas sp. 8 R 14]CRM21998.1 hypothetical protein [Pseudomonas sp. 8 R 14]